MPRHYLVLSTCPDLDCARSLAETLVREHLAACVNIVPAVHSVYEWQGTVQQETECQLLIKTTSERYAALEDVLRRHHPYELPEIIAVPLTAGLPAYLHWINHQTENNE
jgi:periplasmic divalent cation tolerance protein